jgi:hypothetical protein
MSEITLENIAKTMEAVLKQEIEPINTRLDNIEKTQALHSASLEQLITEKKGREDNDKVSTHRFDRLEKWAKEVGNKVDIKIEL